MDVVVIDAAVVICDVVVAKYFDFAERFFDEIVMPLL